MNAASKGNILLSYIVVVPRMAILCHEEISDAALSSLHEAWSVTQTICTVI